MFNDKQLFLRLSKWLQGGRAAPYILDVKLTDTCNLSCLSCVARDNNVIRNNYETAKKRELTSSTWLSIISEACSMGVKEIRIAGAGEPVMRKKNALI